jgi:AcrR family transcriptional regulator
MASSALYRYFASRDELLTALIMDAYDALGEAAERAVAHARRERAAEGVRGCWRALARAVRAWSKAHPHEYALLYGTPVPGYAAPKETVQPAARVPVLMLGLLEEHAGELRPAGDPPAVRGEFAEQLRRLGAEQAPHLSGTVLARAIGVWIQLIGMIGFELFGHLVGSADPADGFFAWTVEDTADRLGLPGRPAPA